MDRDAGWVELAGRLAGCGALLLGGDGQVVAAEPQALALLGCEDLKQAQSRWKAADASALCRDASASITSTLRGELTAVVGNAPLLLSARLLRIEGDDRCLALIAKAGSPQADGRYAAFARQLGHDVRGPLNALVLNLDLLRTTLEGDDAAEEVSARRVRYLAAIQREIERMNQTLAAAVAAAKAEA